jgi:hypothetical protein
LVLIALASIVLFGFVGLAIDGSAKFSDRRHAQNAADTAALAAALAKVNALTAGKADGTACPPPSGLPSDVCADLINAGSARAISNGFGADISKSTVEIYSPPISGYYSGNSEYVQVIITSHVKTTIMRVLGIQQTDNIVSAVAYTKKGGNLADGAMVISYDPSPNCSSGVGSGGGSVDVSGNSTVNLIGGGIFLNSDEVCGFAIPNCANLNITSGSITSAATVDNIDQDGCTTTAPENLNPDKAVVIPDEVYFPDVPPACSQLSSAYADPLDPNPLNPDTYYINPGYYTDFPQSNINGNIVGNRHHIIMNPGVYCVGSDFHWNGNTFDSLDGSSGVTIYLKSGVDFDLSIHSPITLNAPTSGDYQGYLIIQEGTHTSHGSCQITGGTHLEMEGLIFAPYCNITVNGGSDPTAEINAQLIGWDISITGNAVINFNYNPSNQVKIKRKVGLMK